MSAVTLIASALLLPALAGIGYTVHALIAVRRFGRRLPDPPATAEPVTLLKPLHGLEPRLGDNLATFLAQEWAAPIQVVAGTNRADDPALRVAAALGEAVTLRAGAPPLGANAKIANLANLLPAARHGLLVLSDSDMAVPRHYLIALAAALARPGTGAVTCVYWGRGDAGGWSRFAAAGISYHFLPQLLVGIASGLARPGMGSTIALRRETLDAVGGFARFANSLADDYELGEAVRALGLTVAIPPLLLTHGCAEAGPGEVWRHERRWTATIRAINLPGHLGSVLTYPVPLALAALALWPAAGAVVLAAALLARLLLARGVDRLAGARTAPLWWLPARDLFSFAVFLASFTARHVDWRGAALRMGPRGRVTVVPEIP